MLTLIAMAPQHEVFKSIVEGKCTIRIFIGGGEGGRGGRGGRIGDNFKIPSPLRTISAFTNLQIILVETL